MPTALCIRFEIKKLSVPTVVSSDAAEQQSSEGNNILHQTKTVNRLSIVDEHSSLKFLIDTGADVSALPYDPADKTVKFAETFPLFAANGTSIKVYGIKEIELNLGLRRSFTWKFFVADIQTPIIGSDFLAHYGLLVDMQNNRLIDSVTKLRTANLSNASVPHTTVKMMKANQIYADILSMFPEVLKPLHINQPIKSQISHHILTNGPPVFCRPRRLDPQRLEAAKREIDELLKAGICRPSKSNWSSPAHLVKKKDSNEWRLCGDYRALNRITVPDRYPVPFLQDFANVFHGKTIFSKIDLRKAYHQVPVEPSDIPKTAIALPFGLFEFNFMTFGLRNASQTFQRLMNEVCRDLDFAFCYLDDIIIASANEQKHKQHLHVIFGRLNEYGLHVNVDKCELGKESLIYLGHLISSDGIRPRPEKVETIRNFSKPSIAKELIRFMAMINFYRRFIPHAVDSQMILNSLVDGKKRNDTTPIVWSDETSLAFEKCKEDLSNATLLAFPHREAELQLVVDASDTSVGGVLHQIVNNVTQPLGFYSKKLTNAQQKYSTYDRELTAIYQAVRHFRHMLEGRNFHVLTDHRPLVHAFNGKNNNASPRQIRHLDFISQFSTDIRHIAGVDNVCADFLSRINELSSAIDFEKIAQAQQDDDELRQLLSGSMKNNLTLRHCIIPGTRKPLYCDVSTINIRPFIPRQFREEILTKIHGISHPGARGTTKLVTQRFIWTAIKRDCTEFAKRCIECQRSKVTRHTKAPLQTFKMVEDRFKHIHIDIIGPLPQSDGYRYCLTIIDRFSRWPEAVPLMETCTEEIARKLIEVWIARFGVPHRITTDQGRQFESFLFRDLMHILGINHLRTTAYHPQANGLVERSHRTLKAAIMCRKNDKWSAELPTILLGLRSTFKCDINATPAEMVYGKSLTLPGQFFGEETTKATTESDFIEKFRETMANLQPTQTSRHGNQSVFIHKSLRNCSRVFLRNDFVRRSLQPPYNGPFPVIERGDKFFKIQIRQKHVNVSIDRLKPAFLTQATETGDQPVATDDPSTSTNPPSVVTRSGRKVHFPDRYCANIN